MNEHQSAMEPNQQEKLLAELDASDAICKRAIAYNGTDQDSIVDDPIWKFIVHARDALPIRNAQLRKLLDLLPWVQHEPGCTQYEISWADLWAGVKDRREEGPCTCGLSEKLKAAGVE